MKIRQGFVSNSSTSSFVVAGFFLPKKTTIEKVLEKLFGKDEDFPTKENSSKTRGCGHKKMDSEYCPSCGARMWIENNDYDYEYELQEYIFEKLSEENMRYLEEVNFIGIKLQENENLKKVMISVDNLGDRLGLDKQKATIISGIDEG